MSESVHTEAELKRAMIRARADAAVACLEALEKHKKAVLTECIAAAEAGLDSYKLSCADLPGLNEALNDWVGTRRDSFVLRDLEFTMKEAFGISACVAMEHGRAFITFYWYEHRCDRHQDPTVTRQ